MVKVKVTYNAKPKRTQAIQAQTYDELVQKIYQIFNIEDKKLTFMKPRIKDQQSFVKDVKQDSQILIVGALKKQKTPQQIEKQKKQEQQLKRLKEQLKLNPHQRILNRLKQKGIPQRGFDYFNQQTNRPQDLGIDYALAPLYLLKYCNQFKVYCQKYQCLQKNPDGLIIEQLGKTFKYMDQCKQILCPLDWISAWICYCADDIQFPYPTYSVDYFLNRTFATIRMAFEVQLQKKQQEPNSRVDCGTKCFGVDVLTKKTDITRLDEDDEDAQKQMDKKVTKYFLQCDLGRPQFNNLEAGIKQRFKQKKLWRNFYGFDIQYSQKMIAIERLPKFLLLHCSRWGYPEAREQWEQIQFNQKQKSNHIVPIPRVIDLYDMCDNNLRQKLDQGIYERQQMFYPYQMDQRFQIFQKQLPGHEHLSQKQIKYRFLDSLLFKQNIYHQFWFDNVPNFKPTGQFRIVGVVYHKGPYYHRPNEQHKHNCKGQFMTFMYKKGRQWVKYQKAQVSYIDIDEVTNVEYWGGKQSGWTPVLFLYQELLIRNMQVQTPQQPRKDRHTATRRRRG